MNNSLLVFYPEGFDYRKQRYSLFTEERHCAGSANVNGVLSELKGLGPFEQRKLIETPA